ncbi:MAG TPA: hypothetical protein ENO22_03255 [candidate division Zixibacteria bacterium]|nr:hypothetical protein [candidate division Zixibacteria bacterium]HEQ98341.1 hypothetical protein [candidate division Zixibacteria bacterium]
MSSAYLHILLNHVPVIGILIGLAILITGLVFKKALLIKTSLAMLLIFAVFAVPTYLTGEPAEEEIEHQPGVSEEMAHEHEEAAELAFIVSLIMGALALISLAVWKVRSKMPSWTVIATLLVAILSAALMLWTAHLGGKVRRPELRDQEYPQETPDVYKSSQK